MKKQAFLFVFWMAIFLMGLNSAVWAQSEGGHASRQADCFHALHDETKHVIAIGIGEATNAYAAFMPLKLAFSLDYQYRVAKFYDVGIGAELTKWLDESFFEGAKGGHVRIYLNNEFYPYRSDFFAISIKLGIGYVYNQVGYSVFERDYESMKIEEAYAHGVELRTGIGFSWRINECIGLKYDVNLADDIFEAKKYLESGTQTENIVYMNMLFKVLFYI